MKRDISAFMATDLVCFSPDDDIVYATRILLEKHFSGAPVIDRDGRLVGVLSKKDCMQIVYNTAYHQDWGGQVAHYMSRDVETIDADSDVLEVAEKFMASRFRRFPVLRDGRLVGQISRCDVLRAIDEIYLRNVT